MRRLFQLVLSSSSYVSHPVDNPDRHSELELLQTYAPTVPTDTLLVLISLFDDLRGMVDEGLVGYPYSLRSFFHLLTFRELVNIVRHMEQYPEDSLLKVLENVFSFDSFDPQLRNHLKETFH